MSGQLVGEVLDASAALRARGLSERGFHALVAIAERCHPQTRQGSVRWDHIRDGLYGASKRTAERAVRDLKTAGVLRVVKSGFNNNQGRICAPIYEIGALTDTDTQMAESLGTDTDKTATDTDKPGGRYRQNANRYRHPGVVLDGSIDGPIDGPIDGKGARAKATYLPDDWSPAPEVVAQMRAEQPHIDQDTELNKFRDHWHSTTKNAMKRDWNAAYRNWIRNAAKWTPHNSSPDGMTAYERKTAHNYTIFQALADDADTGPNHKEIER
jgi:hypothetical protein